MSSRWRMSVLPSSLFILALLYCSLVVLLHCAVSWINKQTKQTNNCDTVWFIEFRSVTSDNSWPNKIRKKTWRNYNAFDYRREAYKTVKHKKHKK